MRKIIYYGATSADGYIARPDGVVRLHYSVVSPAAGERDAD